MNKKEFCNCLSKRLNRSMESCLLINEVLEKNFFLSSSQKNKIVKELISILSVDEKEAVEIYEVAISILKEEVKEKLKHPFGA